MTEFAWACGLFALLATLLHFASTLLAARRLRSAATRKRFAGGPPVSLLRTPTGQTGATGAAAALRRRRITRQLSAL